MKWAKSKDGGDIVEIMSAQGEIIGTAVNVEDAVLWAAAPELVAALTGIIKAYENSVKEDIPPFLGKLIRDARKVTKQAEGVDVSETNGGR